MTILMIILGALVSSAVFGFGYTLAVENQRSSDKDTVMRELQDISKALQNMSKTLYEIHRNQ